MFSLTKYWYGKNLSGTKELDTTKLLFAENSGLVIQSEENLMELFQSIDVECFNLGKVNNSGVLEIKNNEDILNLDVAKYRDIWFSTSKDLDKHQTKGDLSEKRFKNYKDIPLQFKFLKILMDSLVKK